jgi:twinkle protein
MLVTAREFAAAHKNGRTGIVLDPWNQLEHYRPPNLSETEYVSMALSASIRITRETGAHLWIVAHPAKMPKDRGTGERPIPTPYDISGSAHWYNKADNCITIHRDVMAEPGSTAYGMVDVHVQKVRFRHIGRPGIVSLWYDGGAGRYLEQRAEAGYARPLL